MKKIFPLLSVVAVAALATSLISFAPFVVSGIAQSGRKIVRPASPQPLPPIQAPVFTPPDPEPEPTEEFVARSPLVSLPESLRKRELQALDNSSFRLGDFSDKVVVVNLWASWCGPCRREVPEYEQVRKEFAAGNVEFIGLTPEDPRTASSRVKKFARSVNFGFRLGWADRETARTLMNGSRAVPQTLVIAPGGRVIRHWDGYQRGHSGDLLRATIKQAIAEGSGESGE